MAAGRRANFIAPSGARLSPLLPWLDRKGRLSPLRASVFALLWVPGLVYAGRYALRDLGPRPLHEALLAAGAWTIWLLLVSLAVTPAKAVLGLPGIVVVRRVVGLAALAYGVLHLTLYAADENWRLLHVAAEIGSRLYLIVGATALTGLAALGWTSRDSWVKRLGPGWKRLHRLAYPLTALGVFHYYLQSKADVSAAVLASGLFAWLMLWRLLPAGRDRDAAGLALLAVAAGLATAAFEFAWYGLATRVNPWRVLHGELGVSFGLRPAAEMLALGLLVAASVELRRLSLTRRADRLWCGVLLHAAAGSIGVLGAAALGLGGALYPDSLAGVSIAAACVGIPVLLGAFRRDLLTSPVRRWMPTLGETPGHG
jgi:sulfoxide reductase heme-binding subunit YedZ